MEFRKGVHAIEHSEEKDRTLRNEGNNYFLDYSIASKGEELNGLNEIS